MSDHVPDPGVPQSPPGPQSEPGAAHTEVFASAEFATGPGYGTVGGAEPGATPGTAGQEAEQEARLEAGREVAREAGQGAGQGFAGQPGQAWQSAGAGQPGQAGQPWQSAGMGQPGQPGQAGQPWQSAGVGLPGQPGQPWQSGEPLQPIEPGRAGRGNRRAGWIVGLGLGYAVLAAGTAFGVIGHKSPAAVDVTAVDASAYAAPVGSASATSGATAKPSPSAAHSTAAPTSAAPTKATPTSTVTGTVSSGTHHGDLRYFLLPPPQGSSSVQGDPDGTKESLSDVVSEYGGTSDVRSFLNQSGFKTACTRTYQDSNIGANVTIELIQFGSSGGASDWESGFTYSGSGYESISVSGESGARGWSYAKDGQYDLIGVYRDGDTFFQVELFGTQVIPAADLGQVVSAEHSRLAHG